MKKILFISPLPPPYYGSALSSEACLDILNKNKEFEVKNIKLNYSESMKDIGKVSFKKIKGIKQVLNQIDNNMLKFSPDLVYFVPATTGLGLIRDYIFVRRIKKYKKRILFHVRSRITQKDYSNPFYRKIYKSMLKDEKTIVLGDKLIPDLHSIISKKNIFVLPNAIKNELRADKIKKIIKRRLANKMTTVIFLSNMDETKGWFRLLQACTILKKKRSDFKCLFIGEFPSDRERIKFHEYVKNEHLTAIVKHLGRKIGKEKNKFLSQSDIMVFPTKYKLETFGRVIVEGMMFAMPVIASNIATIPDIIEDGKTGFLTHQNTPEEISKLINLLMENKKKMVKMGKNGRKSFLAKFEIKNYSKKFKEILSKA